MSTVRMTHPDLPDQPIEVPESAVPIHRRSGWRTAEDDGTSEPVAAPAASTDPAAAKRRTESTAIPGKE